MPEQETFFEQRMGNRRVEVIKTYDRSYAYEVFSSMDDKSLSVLAAALNINSTYDPNDVPDPNEPEYLDFVWAELLEAGIEDIRLDPNVRSFFVVSEHANGERENLYVSADWPSAEAFAKKLIVRDG